MGLKSKKERLNNRIIPKHDLFEVDGSKECSEKIAKMFPKSDDQKTILLSGYENAFKRREEIIATIAKLERERQTIDQAVQLELQDAGYAIAGDYRISWLKTITKRLDTSQFKSDNPLLYDKYCRESASRRFVVKRVA